MKKKLAIIGSLVLIISLSIFIYNEIIAKSFRYQTPEESFEKSSSHKSELVEILEENDIALVIYKNEKGVYSDHVIVKDNRGWSPLTVNYKNKKVVSRKEGFFYVKEIENKYVVEIVTIRESAEDIPSIGDNLYSEFVIRSYETNTGRRLVYGFLVTSDKISEGYSILLDGQEIPIL